MKKIQLNQLEINYLIEQINIIKERKQNILHTIANIFQKQFPQYMNKISSKTLLRIYTKGFFF